LEGNPAVNGRIEIYMRKSSEKIGETTSNNIEGEKAAKITQK
jgi:hypothetical protein